MHTQQTEFNNLTLIEYIRLQKLCSPGVRSIYKRLLEFEECFKILVQYNLAMKTGTMQDLDKLNNTTGFTKTMRNIFNQYYYENKNILTQENIKANYKACLEKYKEAINDLETNKCQLCDQLNTKIEMANVTKQRLEEYGMFFDL